MGEVLHIAIEGRPVEWNHEHFAAVRFVGASFLNQLILPCKENNFRPAVRSRVLRRKGYVRGIRLISVHSLREFIKAHEEPAAASGPPPMFEI